MRAILMRCYGGPEVLKLEDVARPTPLLTEVLVRVRAAGTNPVDAYVRSGAFQLLKPPAIPGWDLSGVVEAVAPGVNRFRVGDEVFGMPLFPRASSRGSRPGSITWRPEACRSRASPRGKLW